ANAVEPLADAGIPLYTVDGTRGRNGAGGGALDYAASLSESPTVVGETALYGIDYTDDPETFRSRLAALEPADRYTCNVICVHQRVWPPLYRQTADISAFDLMEGTDVHVNCVLAGGVNEPQRWEHDDFDYHVSYPGSTHPRERDAGETPTAVLLETDTEGTDHRRVRLEAADPQEELDAVRRALDTPHSDLAELETETLVDLYGLASRAKRTFEDRRQEIRDELLGRVTDDGTLDGALARVDRTTRRRTSLKADEDVFREVDRAGVSREEVTTESLDRDAVEELVEAGRLDGDRVFDTSESATIRLRDLSLPDE
ncbi:MAG: hypothetical protein ABEI75_00650, partial [Halobaculum sp.]